jgi:hypothetical protein
VRERERERGKGGEREREREGVVHGGCCFFFSKMPNRWLLSRREYNKRGILINNN